MKSRDVLGVAALASFSLLACSSQSKPSVKPPTGVPLRLINGPATLPVIFDRTAAVQNGRSAGDSSARVVIRPMTDSIPDLRLCGALVGGSRLPPALVARWPLDTGAPVLAWRTLSTASVHGVRFLLPGNRAYYYFEGVTQDGTRRVSVRWPIMADPATPVPVGAPDSLMESLLTPQPKQLDSLVAALTLADTTAIRLPAGYGDSTVHREQAVLLLRDLPVHEVALSPACPTATVALPVLARTDVLVRLPTLPGDVISAHANVTDGTVRIGFDEAPPREELRERASMPHAVIEAGAMPRVTLRVRVQIVPRAQTTQQVVYLSLKKSRPVQ